ncbi:ribbon-helix-helix domain-containing protein [Paralysiella testudinis]|uniref:Ribbon-helix-helix domain-containing protein n=1 Tax=Paralysiella testudinis TaxID=2809020 RepID=A0A892ZML3_9NEIS|nr:ribbon-helix-helix domain-containing protein [Paralysiella testudinis]QRQ83007.1 ribbon-helix-helix domain-containing protein [Paralysiella testudinis]
MEMARWNVAVSTTTDQDLRRFLVNQGRGRKGELSRFIEEAVQAHILELTAKQAKAANIKFDETELASMVDEALDWARQS